MSAAMKPDRLWTQLEQAIHAVCTLRGDGPGHRQALLDDCQAESPEMQADLLRHFRAQQRMYEARDFDQYARAHTPIRARGTLRTVLKGHPDLQVHAGPDRAVAPNEVHE